MEDPMTDLGSTERRLLRALRAADEPSDDDRARVRARVLLKVAAASGVASALATTAANAPGAAAAAGTAAGTASVAPGAAATATGLAGFAAGSWKIGAAIVTMVGAVGGAAWVAQSPQADPSASVAPQSAAHTRQQPTKPAPPPAETAAEVEPESAAPSSAQKPRSRARSADPAPSANSKPDEFDSELALLTDAQRALKQGDAERALAALNEHASEHPDGALARERAGIRAVALCESGKTAEGKREARRFLSRNPKSPLAVRVRAACLDAKK
jgi:hypothetical protein